jgi:DNA-binding transcriptional LysR family regulator
VSNNIGEMEMLILVVDTGSFAAAAKALRLTPSAVSKGIAGLELRLGVRLLQRTTRTLAVTAEGEAFYERAVQLLAEFQELESCFTNIASEPRGKLRVNSNVPYGLQQLIPLLPAFTDRYPKIIVDLTLSDALTDLNEERVDVAIRLGAIPQAKLRARNLGATSMMLVASPAYLRKHGAPHHPDELKRHRCIAFNFRRTIDSWPFLIDGSVVHHTVSPALMADSGESVKQVALSDGGIARLGKFQVIDDLSSGRLIAVLPNFCPADELQANALYSAKLHLPSRVNAFVDFLEAHGSLSE